MLECPAIGDAFFISMQYACRRSAAELLSIKRLLSAVGVRSLDLTVGVAVASHVDHLLIPVLVVLLLAQRIHGIGSLTIWTIHVQHGRTFCFVVVVIELNMGVVGAD